MRRFLQFVRRAVARASFGRSIEAGEGFVQDAGAVGGRRRDRSRERPAAARRRAGAAGPRRDRPARPDRGPRPRRGPARRCDGSRAASATAGSATSCAIAGSRRRHAPSPWTGSWSRARSVRPARVVALDPLGVEGPSHHAGARFALRGDADGDQGPDAVRARGRDLQRGHRRPSRTRADGTSRSRARRRRPGRRRRASRSVNPSAASQRVRPWPRASGR